MKLNLFNGIIVFEGSVSELRTVMEDLPEMTTKLYELQVKTNEAVMIHQTALARIEANKGTTNRPPGHLQ